MESSILNCVTFTAPISFSLKCQFAVSHIPAPCYHCLNIYGEYLICFFHLFEFIYLSLAWTFLTYFVFYFIVFLDIENADSLTGVSACLDSKIVMCVLLYSQIEKT